MNKAPFIAIEGMDGAGKATQSALLEKHLYENYVSDKEPFTKPYIGIAKIESPDYNTSSGRKLKKLLTKPDADHDTKCTLFAINRMEQSASIILNLHSLKTIVLADRWMASMFIYGQDHEADIVMDDRMVLENECYDIPYPDLYIVLTLDPQEGRKRLLSRYNGDSSMLDAHEKDLSMQQRVYDRYHNLKKNKGMYKFMQNTGIFLVDGQGTIDEVHKRICTVVDSWMILNKFSPIKIF